MDYIKTLTGFVWIVVFQGMLIFSYFSEISKFVLWRYIFILFFNKQHSILQWPHAYPKAFVTFQSSVTKAVWENTWVRKSTLCILFEIWFLRDMCTLTCMANLPGAYIKAEFSSTGDVWLHWTLTDSWWQAKQPWVCGKGNTVEWKAQKAVVTLSRSRSPGSGRCPSSHCTVWASSLLRPSGISFAL